MHFYKRDLTPIKENFGCCNDRTPYKANFQNYEGALMGKSFKEELLNNLGGGIKCVSSSVSSKRFATFSTTEPTRSKSASKAKKEEKVALEK